MPYEETCSISLKSSFALVTILLLASATGWAQDSRISGTVTDSTGGVIPGVEVTVTNLATGASRQAVTDDSGRYSVPQLYAGNYRVSASMAGFDAQQLELLLDPAQTTEQNFQLSVGAPSNVVEVASFATRINVNPYDMATVIEEKQIEQLPLNGRSYLTLAALSPGIIKGQQGGRGNQMEAGFKSGGLAMEHVAISRHIGFDFRHRSLSFKPQVVMAGQRDDIFSTETSTAGYTVINLAASYTIARQHFVHQLGVNVFNVGDRLYRNHASFI